jgi:hypothetical protein
MNLSVIHPKVIVLAVLIVVIGAKRGNVLDATQ